MATIKKTAVKKPLVKAEKTNSVPRFKNPVVATKDSTQYFEDKYSHYRQAEENLKNVDNDSAKKAKEKWNQAADDRNRQKRKGIPGFDSNGNPMQYKKGGFVGTKKTPVTKKKMGGATKKKC